MSKFNIGDTAYYAHAGQTQIWIVCPECLGSGRLRVILGDDSEVSIGCVCCERGYEGSLGKIQTYQYRGVVEPVMIRGVETELHGEELREEYKFSGCYSSKAENLFATKEGAAIRAEELIKEYEAEETKRLRHKEKQTKSWAWNVSYHRRQIKDARRQIEYHTAKLSVAPKNPKEADKQVASDSEAKLL